MMSTEPRTDVHRPTEIRPEDYEWRHSYDTQPPMIMPAGSVTKADIERAQAAMAEWHKHFEDFVLAPIRRSKATVYGSPNRCDHCGAHLRYGNLYHHAPTGGVIVVGDICADETMEVPDRAKLEQKRIREAAAAARNREAENKAARTRIEQAEKDFPEATAILATARARIAEVEAHNARVAERVRAGELEGQAARDAYTETGLDYFIEDVALRFAKKGYLSEKQAAALVRAHRRETERAAQAEKAAAALEAGEVEAVPDGRQEVTGEIVKEYWKDGYGYGERRHVMIFRDDRGFKLWGSVPGALYDDDGAPHSGDRIAFTAKLEPKDDDPTFGFYKRPTKARYIERAE